MMIKFNSWYILHCRILVLICSWFCSTAAFAQAKLEPPTKQVPDFTVFAPKNQTLNTQIQYEYWDNALQGIVLNLGKSVRRSAMHPVASLGSRRVTGHTSRYRLEGSRVIYSFLNPEHMNDLARYRKYLVAIPEKYNLQNFSRDEQLAYWLNLHNLLLIETVAKNYPKKHPVKIQISGSSLHEAKLIKVNGVPLSLRNIREDIVYKNWQNQDVIYGFHLGDIGGPALMNYAFTGLNVNTVIQELAEEFVTSLRGFQATMFSRKVSKLYEDTKPYYFRNWPNDLLVHLKRHAGSELMPNIIQNKPVEFSKYEYAIADIMGGANPKI